jgi:hypothetical protein
MPDAPEEQREGDGQERGALDHGAPPRAMRWEQPVDQRLVGHPGGWPQPSDCGGPGRVVKPTYQSSSDSPSMARRHT